MSKSVNFLANALCVIYFFGVMLGTILFLVFTPIGFFTDILRIRESGFASAPTDFAFTGVLGLTTGLSLLIPPFRRMYHKLPWLFPLVKICFINVVIFEVANSVMNHGYAIMDTKRHNFYFVLAIIEIVLARALMCLWFHKKRADHLVGS